MSHPTSGPNATRAGAIALYNLLFDLAAYNPDTRYHDSHGVHIDRIDSIPDTKRGAVGIYHWAGRQYIVSVEPMPGRTHPDRDDAPDAFPTLFHQSLPPAPLIEEEES